VSARVVEARVSGYSLSMRFVLKCEKAGLNAVSKELVRRSLNASPLMKPFVTPDKWQLEKCVLKSFSSFEMSFNVDVKLCILLFTFLSV